MKNALPLLTLIFLSLISVANSQDTLYLQDFENGMDDMLIYDIDQLTPNPSAAPPGYWVLDTAKYASSYAAMSTSWYDPPGTSDDWLITPAIPITAGAKLQWTGLSYNPGFSESYMVLASNTDTEISSFQRIVTIDGENFSETTREISLSEFNGDTLYIAFRNISDDKDLLIIDDILVTGDRVSSTTSLAQKQVKIFPNPANEFVRIEVDGKAEVLISNLLGEVLHRSSFSNSTEINLPLEWKGIYHITITGDDFRYTYPIFIH